MSKIIRRDFFPDVPRLKAQLEYIEATETNDVERLKEISERFAAENLTPAQAPGNWRREREKRVRKWTEAHEERKDVSLRTKWLKREREREKDEKNWSWWREKWCMWSEKAFVQIISGREGECVFACADRLKWDATLQYLFCCLTSSICSHSCNIWNTPCWIH